MLARGLCSLHYHRLRTLGHLGPAGAVKPRGLGGLERVECTEVRSRFEDEVVIGSLWLSCEQQARPKWHGKVFRLVSVFEFLKPRLYVLEEVESGALRKVAEPVMRGHFLRLDDEGNPMRTPILRPGRRKVSGNHLPP